MLSRENTDAISREIFSVRLMRRTGGRQVVWRMRKTKCAIALVRNSKGLLSLSSEILLVEDAVGR